MKAVLIITVFAVVALMLVGLAVLTTGAYLHWHIAKLNRQEWDE